MLEAIGPLLIGAAVLLWLVAAVLLPVCVWQIMLNTRAMRAELKRLADDAAHVMRE